MRLRCSEGNATRSSAVRLARSSIATTKGRARKNGIPPPDEPPPEAAAALVPGGACAGAGAVGAGRRHLGADFSRLASGAPAARSTEDEDWTAPTPPRRAVAGAGAPDGASEPARNAGRRGTRLAHDDTSPVSTVGGVTGTSPSSSGASSGGTSSATPLSVDGSTSDGTTGERTAGSAEIAGRPGIPGNDTMGTGIVTDTCPGVSEAAGCRCTVWHRDAGAHRDCDVRLADRAVVTGARNPNRHVHVTRLILRCSCPLILYWIIPQFQIHVQLRGADALLDPPGDTIDIAGTETQSHCHDQVPVSSSAAAVGAAAGADAVGVARLWGAALVDVVALAGAVGPGEAPVDTEAAMFVCVTEPLSPALAIRTLTLTFVGAVWTATGAVDAHRRARCGIGRGIGHLGCGIGAGNRLQG